MVLGMAITYLHIRALRNTHTVQGDSRLKLSSTLSGLLLIDFHPLQRMLFDSVYLWYSNPRLKNKQAKKKN